MGGATSVSGERDGERSFPSMPPLGADYWLCHCEGYGVEIAGRRLGFVENVVFESQLDRPGALRVRGGMFGEKLHVVPVDEVEEIVPREELLRLRPGPEHAPSPRAHRRIGRWIGAALHQALPLTLVDAD